MPVLTSTLDVASEAYLTARQAAEAVLVEHAAVVARVLVAPGQAVEAHQLLIELTESGEEQS